MTKKCIGHIYQDIIPKFKTFKKAVDYQKKYREKNPLDVKPLEDCWNNNDLKELFVRLNVEGYFPDKIYIHKMFSPGGVCDRFNGAPVKKGYWFYPKYKELSDLRDEELKVMKDRYCII